MANIDKNKLIDAIIASSGGKIDRNALNKVASSGDISQLMKTMPEGDKKKLSKALSDKNNLSSMLNNEQARALLNSLLKGGNK